MESSFENQIYGLKNKKASKVPTLKYLVTQSMDGNVPGPVRSTSSNSSQFAHGSRAQPNENPVRLDPSIVAASNNNNNNNNVEARIPMVPTQDDKDPTEGSGDILNSSSKYLQPPSELDLSQLLSTAYEKGAEWIQAGATIALNMFSEETDPTITIPIKVQKRDPVVPPRKPQPKKETTEIPSSLLSKARHPNDPEEPRKAKLKEVTFQEPRSAQTSAIETETDDTAYYNGYCARVRGQGVTLDTIFVNGSGPSNKSLEIRIRLELPPPQPGLYGQLTRDYCGRDDKTLHLRYTHGSVEGTVDVLCPPEIDPHKLVSSVKDHFLLITSP